jgi:hypothetical protein
VIRVFDLATGRARMNLRLTTTDERASLTPDGRSVLITRHEGRGAVALWDLLSGELRCHITDVSRDGPTGQLLFTPDSRFLVVTSPTRLAHVWDLHTPARAPGQQFASVDAAWSALAERNAHNPHAALAWLAAHPADAVPFLAERVKAPETPTARQVAEWIKQLDSDVFAGRETAEAKLRSAVRVFGQTMEEAASETTSPEVRTRLRNLLAWKDRWTLTSEEMRVLRAVEVLERIGSSAAREVLKKLAAGPAEAWVTQDAAAALDRLAKR